MYIYIYIYMYMILCKEEKKTRVYGSLIKTSLISRLFDYLPYVLAQNMILIIFYTSSVHVSSHYQHPQKSSPTVVILHVISSFSSYSLFTIIEILRLAAFAV